MLVSLAIAIGLAISGTGHHINHTNSAGHDPVIFDPEPCPDGSWHSPCAPKKT